jgi:hypothetical protein
MKKTTWTAASTAIVIFGTAAILAQTQQAPQSSAAAQQITVTGCLKASPAGAGDAIGAAGTAGAPGPTGTTGAGTPGTAGATAPSTGDMKFLLTNAIPSSPDASSAPNAAAPPPAPGAAAASGGQTYRLIANPSALSPHVGKKVELTGTLDDQDNRARSSQSPAGGTEANTPALRVASGRVLQAACEP